MRIAIILLLVLLFSAASPKKETIPKLGIVGKLEQDSLFYAAGYSAIGESVDAILSPSLTDDQFLQNIERIKKAKCKLYLCNIFFPGTMKIAGPAVDEEQVLNYAAVVLARAKQAGIPVVVLGSGRSRSLPDGYDLMKAKTDFIALCKKLALLANKSDVKIVLESLQTSETNFLNTVHDAAEVVRAVHHPNFQLNADIFHMMRENEPAENIVAAADVLSHCEIAEKQSRSFPGVQGDDFKPYLRALKQAGYKGPIFIEATSNNLTADAPLSFLYLTRQLQEVYAEK